MVTLERNAVPAMPQEFVGLPAEKLLMQNRQ